MATAMKKCAKILLRNFTAKRIFLQPHFIAQSVNQNRDYSDSIRRETKPEKGGNKGSPVSYCEMLTRKRKEAEKSVIVAFSRGSNVEDMFKSMQEIGGKIINSIYYKAREQRYILFEFEDKQSIEAFQEDQIDLYRILQYHGQRKKVNKRKYMPEFVSKDSLMNVVFDINTLDNAKTLSGQIDMLQYYCCMREHEKRLQFFVSHQVEEVIRRLYPGALVLPFGSSATGFGLADGSDLDMAMFIDRGREQKFLTENLSYLADCRIDDTVLYLKKGGNLLSLAAGIEDVKFILRARVPIIGFRHSYTGLDCDISCNERAGVRTARILYTMAQCSGRFHPLITVVKTWGQVSRISRKGLGGGLSNFMLTMLVVHFLQSRSPPVLPAIKDMYIHDISDTEISRLSTSLEETFLKDVTEIPKPQNKETTGDLLLEFFRYYSEFDFSKYTIDLNSGGICEEKASEDCMRVINPCVEGHNICTNVRKHHLKLFQDKCKLVLKYLESNLIKKIGSPWGLSYVVKPDLCTETTKEIRHVISIDKLFSESETENDQLETKQNETDNDQLASKQVFRR